MPFSKIQRGFEAFEKNTGAPHRLAAGAQKGLTKRASEPLTDFEEDLWFGSIQVGTPAKTFTGTLSIDGVLTKLTSL